MKGKSDQTPRESDPLLSDNPDRVVVPTQGSAQVQKNWWARLKDTAVNLWRFIKNIFVRTPAPISEVSTAPTPTLDFIERTDIKNHDLVVDDLTQGKARTIKSIREDLVTIERIINGIYTETYLAVDKQHTTATINLFDKNLLQASNYIENLSTVINSVHSPSWDAAQYSSTDENGKNIVSAEWKKEGLVNENWHDWKAYVTTKIQSLKEKVTEITAHLPNNQQDNVMLKTPTVQEKAQSTAAEAQPVTPSVPPRPAVVTQRPIAPPRRPPQPPTRAPILSNDKKMSDKENTPATFKARNNRKRTFQVPPRPEDLPRESQRTDPKKPPSQKTEETQSRKPPKRPPGFASKLTQDEEKDAGNIQKSPPRSPKL